jgi:curved DNA-binding protein CbpA
MNPPPLPQLLRLPPTRCTCIFQSTRHHISPLIPPVCRTRFFHPSTRRLSDTFPNHYETLQLPSSATATDIKKQFYALSKQYHPDLNPSPGASATFVKISEAYHVLGSPEKKGKYDKDFHRAHSHHGRHGGSYSSRSAGSSHVGGRPASGLSKRRSAFRGPPPSFYAQGGYGAQGSKRHRAQSETDARHESPGPAGGLGSRPSYRGTGGYSPGSQDSPYFDPDPSMPYFDKASHRRTHDNLGARSERQRPNVTYADAAAGGGGGGPGLLANFVIVSTVVATATVAASFILEFVRAGPGRSTGTAGVRGRREGRPDG